MANAPAPVSDSGNGSGGTGATNLPDAVHSVARPGASKMPESAIPTRARQREDHPSATRIRQLTEVSSRQSMLSANSETEPIVSATANSTQKSVRFRTATSPTARQRRFSGEGLLTTALFTDTPGTR